MKTIIVLGLVVLVLSMVMTTWAQDTPAPTADTPANDTAVSGSSDDESVDVLGNWIRVKRGTCRYWFYWRASGSVRLTGPQITASLRQFFSTRVCR